MFVRLKSHKIKRNESKRSLGGGAQDAAPRCVCGLRLGFWETPAHTDGPPPHFHKGYKELFLVVEGELDFIVDGKPMKVSKGESIDLFQGVVHTFRNSSDKTCKWVNIHSPKGFRSFFEAMGVDANEENALLKSVDQSIIARMIKEAESFDMHIRIPEMAS